jgi:hypothetical protein
LAKVNALTQGIMPDLANVNALTPERHRQGSVGDESRVAACQVRQVRNESRIEG